MTEKEGMTNYDRKNVEEALSYLNEHQQELTDHIYREKYTLSRKES